MRLIGNSAGPTLGFSRWGEGGVVTLSSAWSISNQGIGRDDNLVVVLNALNYPQGSRKLSVIFDEYHHGYGRSPGITSLIETPARLGLAQIGLAFILMAFAVSRRFGNPIPLREGERQRSEYLTSMSSLLRRAHAFRAVRSELERKFMEDAATALGLPSAAGRNDILEAAVRRRPDKADALRSLLSGPPEADESALLALAARWHQMRKELMA